MKNLGKFSVATMIIISLSSSAAAEGLFVGGELGVNFAYVEAKDNAKINYFGTYSTNHSSGAVGAGGVKFGYDFDLWRIYGAFVYNSGQDYEYSSYVSTNTPPISTNEHYELDMENNSIDLLIGANWTPQISNNFKMLIGPYVGYSRLNTDITYDYHRIESNSGIITRTKQENEQTVKQNGVLYGAKFGGIFTFARRHEIDFGVKYDCVKYGDKGDISFSPDIAVSMKNAKRDGVGIYAGYNFKF